jgi:hypothetical protein
MAKHDLCSFDPKIPRMSAYDINKWINGTMTLAEADLAMVHMDGAKRQVFVKLRELKKIQQIHTSSRCSGEVRNVIGEV